MNKVMIQLDILEPVVVDFESKEGYAEVGNFMNCIKPQWDGTDFIDIETEEEKTARLSKLPKKEIRVTFKGLQDFEIMDLLRFSGEIIV